MRVCVCVRAAHRTDSAQILYMFRVNTSSNITLDAQTPQATSSTCCNYCGHTAQPAQTLTHTHAQTHEQSSSLCSCPVQQVCGMVLVQWNPTHQHSKYIIYNIYARCPRPRSVFLLQLLPCRKSQVVRCVNGGLNLQRCVGKLYMSVH